MKSYILYITLVISCLVSSQLVVANEFLSDQTTTSHSIDSTLFKGLKKKGAKIFITTNDEHAKTHLINELNKIDFWSIENSKASATYEVKLIVEKHNLVDREVWIKIIDKSGHVIYVSERVTGIQKGLRTVNFKQSAVIFLVDQHLRKEFFGEQ